MAPKKSGGKAKATKHAAATAKEAAEADADAGEADDLSSTGILVNPQVFAQAAYDAGYIKASAPGRKVAQTPWSECAHWTCTLCPDARPHAVAKNSQKKTMGEYKVCAMIAQHYREMHSVGRGAPYWELQPTLQSHVFDHEDWEICNARKIAFGIKYLQPQFCTALKKVRISSSSKGYILLYEDISSVLLPPL